MALALNCGIPSTPQGRELVQHGSALFPIACYEERLTCYSVPCTGMRILSISSPTRAP